MSKTINMVKKGGTYVAVTASTFLASAGAFAVDHTAAITAAQTDGTANVTAAATAIIAIMAVVTGIGFIIKLMGR